jgi:putative transcriptional regulator
LGKNHKELNNKLEEFRKRASLIQSELAEKVGVSRKSINSIENGVYIPTTVLALKISKELNCSVHDLFQLT